MKRCNVCGVQVPEQAKYCQLCGSSDLSEEMSAAQQAQLDQAKIEQQNIASTNQELKTENGKDENNGSGNILAGVVGAFLFSIIGGFLYFVIYQIGIIAGICGLVIFVLANFGYCLFAKTKNKGSVVGLITAIVATIVMIYLAEYFCISYEIYNVYKEFDITIFDAVRATPEFLSDPVISDAVMQDLMFAYGFGFLATIGNIVNIVKARKKEKV